MINTQVPNPPILWGPLGNPTPFQMFPYLLLPNPLANTSVSALFLRLIR